MNKKDYFQADKYAFSKSFESDSSVGYTVKLLEKKGLTSANKWIDIHYPCKGHIKAQIKTNLPMNPREAENFIYEIFENLEVSCPQTFDLFNLDKSCGFTMTQPIDSEGKTDRMQTTRRFKSP